VRRSGTSASEFSRRAVYVLLFIYIAVSLGYQLVSSASLIATYFGHGERVQQPFELDSETDTVTSMRAAAERAGLRVGDHLESINGLPYRGVAQLQSTRWHAQPADVLRLSVRRANGTRAALSIPLEAHLHRVSIAEVTFLVFIQIVVPLFCLILGYWVALARPMDPNAWFILLLLSYPEAFISVPTWQWWPGIWLALRLYWHLILETLAPVALLWLGMLFPERSRIDIRLPWLKWCILALVAAGLGLQVVTEYSRWYDYALVPDQAIDGTVDSVLKWTFTFCVIFYWISIFGHPHGALPPDARRRLRVLRAGSVIGLGSMLIIFGALPWFGIADPTSIRWVDFHASLLMLVFPLSLAYVVIVQRAMDVRILVRVGTKYALARTTLGVIEIAAAVLIVIFFVVPALESKTRDTLDLTLSALAIVGLIRLFGTRDSLSKRLQNWLDRKFFREAYNAELVLNELAGRVRTMTNRSTLIETVSQRLSEVLHVAQVAALLRRQEVFRLQYAVGLTVDGSVSISAPSLHGTAPLVLYRREDSPFLTGSNHSILETMNAEVVLPLPGRNKLMGLMLLGPKLSEEPYSPSDLRLLESVGVQTGLGLEVTELAHSLAEEAAQRERIQREIEIAREVQERLFPQSIPSLPGLDLAGNCRPASSVGGDYYDIFQLDDERLALAVGDISGKGISAALLMASLRASLRSIAEDGADNLPRLMSKLNRQVYEASAPNRYATFFFALFAPSTLELHYVNAGHNAPILIRDGLEPLRLETGGMIVGLLKESPYLEGMVQLRPGDVLVAYTDGISEAMTMDGEEWGEQRLITACTAAHDLPASGILQDLMDAADAFVQGAPQHDDMTLIVMKLLLA
jgi:sigma-B regulation protein RsbU (phosphoserine phosphatase)